eukprot:COSAG06_NODE_1004_length_11128_cov_5.572944_9_plen_161_part_00
MTRQDKTRQNKNRQDRSDRSKAKLKNRSGCLLRSFVVNAFERRPFGSGQYAVVLGMGAPGVSHAALEMRGLGGKNAACPSGFILKTTILPRQARDNKQRENNSTTKGHCFLAGNATVEAFALGNASVSAEAAVGPGGELRIAVAGIERGVAVLHVNASMR